MSARTGRDATAFMQQSTNYIDPVTGGDIASLFEILSAYGDKMKEDSKSKPTTVVNLGFNGPQTKTSVPKEVKKQIAEGFTTVPDSHSCSRININWMSFLMFFFVVAFAFTLGKEIAIIFVERMFGRSSA